MAGEESSLYLSLLATTMNSLTAINAVYLSGAVNSAYLPLQSEIFSYSEGRILDVGDSASITALKHLSNPNNYQGCSKGNFAGDSWIPSTNQVDNSVPCQSSLSTPATSSTCLNKAYFDAAAPGCTGCMDTFSLLYSSNSKSDVKSFLSSRYTDCSQFNEDLSNTWSNFYLIKRKAFSGILSR